MMFRLNPQSRLLTPEAPGLAALVECLERGRAIHAGAEITAGRPAPWLYCQTSGTSGQAKVIRRSHESWIQSFTTNADMFAITEQDRYAVLGDLGHSLSLYASVEALYLGAALAVLSGQSPKSQAKALDTHKITVLYATPTQLRLLLRGAGAAGLTALSAIRLILCGGGKLDRATRMAVRDLCPNTDLREFYGASETSFIALSNAETPDGSVGRAYPDVLLEIRAPDDTGAGEIWVSSPYLFDGYEVGDSADTKWDNGSLSIGEMGRLDADGHLFVLGRKSRMVTVSDQNVFLEDIEDLLCRHAGITQAAVLARRDVRRGHHLVAMIEGEMPAEATLRRIIRETLGSHAIPLHFHHIPRMPLLPAGKPDLRALEAQCP